MSIQHLDIRNVRNIIEARLEPVAGINLVTGLNASGKTSLLEALFILGRGNSFRTSHIAQVINRDAGALTVFAKLGKGNMGIERKRNKPPRIKISGQRIDRLAELVSHLPVLAISPNSHKLIEAGPKERRQFLDWGVFHVEQDYYRTWHAYVHSLRQRNAGLRQHRIDQQDGFWRQQIAEGSDAISDMRKRYLNRLRPYFQRMVAEILDMSEIELAYQQGWRDDESISTLLDQGVERDRQQGFTRYGAHRADIRIDHQGQPAQQVLSRGQQKLVVCALRLAQAQVLVEVTGNRCLILVDDLPAELDVERRHLLMQSLSLMPGQVFISATSEDLLPLDSGVEHAMFHVEQGNIITVSK